ncbi:DUF2065 domain-containing protein [Deefgea rivuli]|uniref:DUF2065 domain-containing protein n=1 Tax=Deefgea rivuli TaxID=400948 RepID=UPI0004853EAD|nr:DUF2065 domain-containing protein [Deefgea rivuli]
MTDVVLMGLGLMLIFEGIMPFTLPAVWRATLLKIATMTDRQIRIFGFCSLMVGLLISLVV